MINGLVKGSKIKKDIAEALDKIVEPLREPLGEPLIGFVSKDTWDLRDCLSELELLIYNLKNNC
jgi:hypothetical protein